MNSDAISDPTADDWLDATVLRYIETEADDSITLEQVRAVLAKIPGSMVNNFQCERDERA